MRNISQANDPRYARTGKDGLFYNKDGILLATVDTFSSNVNMANAKYNLLGNAQELETPATFSVNLTMSQIVIEDDAFIQELMAALESQIFPFWDFQGSLLGRNGTEQRIIYRDCVPTGQIDLQNITPGDVVKRSWNFFVNRPPKLQNLLGMG